MAELAKTNSIKLLKTIKDREKAHLDSRDHHKRMDQILKIGTLLSSTAVTYLVSSQEDGFDENNTYTYERYMTFSTTILSGLSTLLNSASTAETHGTVAKKYALLANQIEVEIQNNECTKENYNVKTESYREIVENAIAIGPITARRYPRIRESIIDIKEIEMTLKEEEDI